MVCGEVRSKARAHCNVGVPILNCVIKMLNRPITEGLG